MMQRAVNGWLWRVAKVVAALRATSTRAAYVADSHSTGSVSECASFHTSGATGSPFIEATARDDYLGMRVSNRTGGDTSPDDLPFVGVAIPDYAGGSAAAAAVVTRYDAQN